MKKVLKITESQYKKLLLEQMGPEIRFKQHYEYPKLKQHGLVNSYSDYNKKFYNTTDIGKTIYDVFDCSSLRDDSKWLDYGHCIVDNISMAVSVVPVIGTIASGVFDLLNSAVYLGEAAVSSISGDFKEAGMSLGFAGLSALGIIPGVTEFKALGKVSKGVIKNTDNILNELSKQGIKKGSKKAEDIKKVNQVIEKYSKEMSTIEKKQLGEVLDLLGNPKVKEGIKNMGKFNDFTQKFMKSTGLRNYQLRTLIGSKDFNKILKNNGGDIYEALNSNETKKLISNIIAQGVSALAMAGIVTLLKTTKKKKEKILKEKNYSEEEIKDVNGYISKMSSNLPELQKEVLELELNKKVINIVDSKKNTEEKDGIITDFDNNWDYKKEGEKIFVKRKESSKWVEVNQNNNSYFIIKSKVFGVGKIPVPVINYELKKETEKMKKDLNAMSDEEILKLYESNEKKLKKNKIRITEGQHKRLFTEQTNHEECNSDDKTKELFKYINEKFTNLNTEIKYNKEEKTCMLRINVAEGILFFINLNGIFFIKNKNTNDFYKTKFIFNKNTGIIFKEKITVNSTGEDTNLGFKKTLKDLISYYNEKTPEITDKKDLDFGVMSDNIIEYLSEKNIEGISQILKSLSEKQKCKLFYEYKKKTGKFFFGDDALRGLIIKNDDEYEKREKIINEWAKIVKDKPTSKYCCDNHKEYCKK